MRDIPFVNRFKEIQAVKEEIAQGNLVVLYGRRRMGKTRLIHQVLQGLDNSHYFWIHLWANRGTPVFQLDDLFTKLAEFLPLKLRPKNFQEFFEILTMMQKEIQKHLVIVIDEFPYLVEADEFLPSVVQEWIDKIEGRPITLILLGSAQSMMHQIFLDSSAPLYKRARRCLKISPMGYKYFCDFLKISPLEKNSFLLYSLVGGVPKYWQFIDPSLGPIENADVLFFDELSFFDTENELILKDEGIKSQLALTLLQALGKGAVRPSEIAQRIGIKASDLSRPLNLLLDSCLIQQEVPFGEKIKNSKKVHYVLKDLSLSIHYKLAMNHRGSWSRYSIEEKTQHLTQLASFVFERELRSTLKGQGYWEDPTKVSPGLEFDCVCQGQNGLEIYEIKWTLRNKKEKIIGEMEEKFKLSALARKGYSCNQYNVLDGIEGLKILAK